MLAEAFFPVPKPGFICIWLIPHVIRQAEEAGLSLELHLKSGDAHLWFIPLDVPSVWGWEVLSFLQAVNLHSSSLPEPYSQSLALLGEEKGVLDQDLHAVHGWVAQYIVQAQESCTQRKSAGNDVIGRNTTADKSVSVRWAFLCLKLLFGTLLVVVVSKETELKNCRWIWKVPEKSLIFLLHVMFYRKLLIALEELKK